MRRVVASVFVSLDGVMQAPGGPEEDPSGGFAFGGWVFPYWDEQLDESMGKVFDRPFDLLLGRKTYEIFAAFWPFQEDEIAERFNSVTKYVATSSDLPLDWHRTVPLRGDVPAEIAKLKQGEGPDLLIQGSSVLIQSLLARHLIDELTLLTFPVLLGRGKKLLEGISPGALKLEEAKISGSGVVISRYVPGGPVQTGSFASSEPSQAEIARRLRWQQEG